MKDPVRTGRALSNHRPLPNGRLGPTVIVADTLDFAAAGPEAWCECSQHRADQGHPSGFIHSYVMELLRDATGSYTYGLLFISAIGVMGLLLLLSLTRRLAGHEKYEAVMS